MPGMANHMLPVPFGATGHYVLPMPSGAAASMSPPIATAHLE